MGKHTPGPWFADSLGYVWRVDPTSLHQYGGSIRYESPLAMTYLGSKVDGNNTWYPLNHNATLIAAAPELLRAAKDFVEWFDCDRIGDKPMAELHYARAAIAKAEREI